MPHLHLSSALGSGTIEPLKAVERMFSKGFLRSPRVSNAWLTWNNLQHLDENHDQNHTQHGKTTGCRPTDISAAETRNKPWNNKYWLRIKWEWAEPAEKTFPFTWKTLDFRSRPCSSPFGRPPISLFPAPRGWFHSRSGYRLYIYKYIYIYIWGHIYIYYI